MRRTQASTSRVSHTRFVSLFPRNSQCLLSCSSLFSHAAVCLFVCLQSTGDVVADRYQEEMRLVARINDWHTRLEPILEVQEGRHGFDIQECAVELLDTIRTEQTQAPPRDAAADAPEPPHDVAFAHMVHGREPWEVCRYFLSSLLLMNCGNIQVAAREPLEFRVMSTVPCFDAANTFQMVQAQQQQQHEEEEAGAVSASVHDASDSSSESSSDSQTERARSRRGAAKQRRKHRG